ncbi:MAG TPA: TonB family protein [Reyranella sp.]|nr:TonB family protein [Reyranella sp.]
MATAMSASLHAAAIVAVVAALPWQPDASSEWGANVTFERALKVDDTSLTAPVAITVPEATPTDPPSSADFLPPTPAVEIATPQLPPVIEAPPVTAAELVSPRQMPVIEAPPQPQEASAAPESLPLEAKLEEMLPRAEGPPNVSAQDFARAKPAAPPPARQQQAQPAPAQPPPARQPVQEAKREGPPPGQPARVAPQDAYAQRRFEEDYFLQIVRKISRYRFHSTARQSPEQGLVVTRMTIARDGRLIDVALVRSSGFPNLDWAVVETIRQASPFAPLPAELGQNQRTFIVPVNYSRDR